jgi:hypothetical protein
MQSSSLSMSRHRLQSMYRVSLKICSFVFLPETHKIRLKYFILQTAIITYVLIYLLRGTTVLVELWPPHIFYVRFRDNSFLKGGVVSPTPKPQPGESGYLS